MENIREIARKIILENSPYGIVQPESEARSLNMLLQFGKLVCKLQKQECAENAEADYNLIPLDGGFNNDVSESIEVYVINSSILNCKNVCDE